MQWNKFFLSMCVFFAATLLPVQAYNQDNQYDYDRVYLPECDASSVLNNVMSRFHRKEARFWRTGLSVSHIEKVQETAWRPWDKKLIPRRYCSAVAVMSDGKKRRVSYSIRHRLGLLGMSWNVQSCISGLDYNYGYGAECRSARP